MFIAEENLNAADRVLDTIEQEAKVLAAQPLMGRARPDLAEDNRCHTGSVSGTIAIDRVTSGGFKSEVQPMDYAAVTAP